jgi:class 3 adenylate cyclase/tetratricopeptide (TPR) repeat protein
MPSEERKIVTVLFADLVGSTELAGGQDPERTRAILDRFYDTMAAEIERSEGTLEKFVGDAVMAAFGAPAAHEDDAERAIHAALAMQRELAAVFGDRLALRIGVNTGEVVVGRPREGSSFVTGDAVNVCARLEQAAAPGEILVGERTVAAARGAFEFAEPMRVEAKGKPGGVVCRRVVRALSLMRPRGVGGLDPVLVGRDREFEQLGAAYRRVASEGTPHLLTILGDAGVGKTRLARELWQWLSAQSPQPLLRTGRCLSYGQGVTYWPLAEVLREQFGILESDSPETTALRLDDRDFLGVTLGLAPPEEMHPLTVRERLHAAWVELVQELVEERPTVVLIEDLHWAEVELRGLLETLVERVRGPLLLLTTARLELLNRSPGWGEGRSASLTRLEALPPADTGQLLDALLGVECPDSLRYLVIERAEGNPFFVEELIATLVDRGVLERRNGGWSFGELPPGFSVPDSVQAVLAARIDLLPPAEKAALQAASVIGRVFWTGPVNELVDSASPDFGMLEERDFVRRRSGSSIAGEQEYVIKHALTREVAYGTLPKAKRAPLHAGFAAWLERVSDGDDEHASMLAHHYAETVRAEDIDLAWPDREDQVERLREKAVAWSRRAAELAVGRYEIDEGLALLHRALELEPDPGQQAELWHRIGRANALKFDGQAFWTAMEKAIEIGGPSADVQVELAFQSVRRWGMWQREPVAALVEGWIERALELAEEGSPNHAKALYARSAWSDDEPAAHALQAIAEQLGDPGLRSLALASLANVAWGAGDFDRARAWTDEQLELLPDLSDPDDRTRALLDAVLVYLGAADLPAAAQASKLHMELAEGLTPHHRLHGIGLRILVETLGGRWNAVRKLTSQGERAVEANLAAATPCPQNVSTLLNCAVASTYAGDEAEARRLEVKADAIGMEGYRMWFEPPRIRLALARNELTQLERLVALEPMEIEPPAAFFDALVALGDSRRIEAEAPKRLKPGTYAEPFALRALGVARGDRKLLHEAATRFQAMGLDWHADQTRKLFSSSLTV